MASNWLIHAGKIIYEDMKKEETERWGLRRWGRWTEAIRDILEAGGQTDEVTARLRAAWDMILSLDPNASELKGSSMVQESNEAKEVKEGSGKEGSSEVNESSEVKIGIKVKDSIAVEEDSEMKEDAEIKEDTEKREDIEMKENTGVKEGSEAKQVV